MLLSIANAGPRNVESSRSQDLIPPALQTGAQNLLSLLESYYEFLNGDGMPSREISSISTLKDIDLVSLKYLDQIRELIGKSIPNSRAINPIELYKLIVKYYSTRGSEDSIHTFFKIFFDQIVQITYPKDHLFDLSGACGAWLDFTGEVRNTSDTAPQTIQGMTFTPEAEDGTGQLVSIRIIEGNDSGYGVESSFLQGAMTLRYGAIGQLNVVAGPITGGGNTYEIPSAFYCDGTSNGKPTFSERLDTVTPFVGTPSRFEWDGSKWRFTVGSSIGDVYAFFSTEDVADPSLVTTWSDGWTGLNGSITSITTGGCVVGQAFLALLNEEGLNDWVLISVDVLSDDWLAPLVAADRTYLTSNPLTDPVGPNELVSVSGSTHPMIFGEVADFGGEYVWVPSDQVDEWTYNDNKSFGSHDYKLFDGEYWQPYSYEIRSDLDSSEWYDDYLKFVHPAGLKLFSAIVVEIVTQNKWDQPIDYAPGDISENNDWLKGFIPPHALDSTSIGYHTPKFQPGYLRDRFYRYLYAYLFDRPDGLSQEVLMKFKMVLLNSSSRDSLVWAQRQTIEKFLDPVEIGAGMLHLTIEELDAQFSNTSPVNLSNISAFVVPDDPNIGDSYYDLEEGGDSGNWSSASLDNQPGDVDLPWENGYFENV